MPPTIAANAASAIHSERRSRKSVPLTQQQREQLAQKREERNVDVDEKLTQWFQNTLDLADRLAEKYDMKPRYFLDKMFHGGARMIHAHQKVNPWNAFVSMRTEEEFDSDDEDDENDNGPEVLKDVSGSLAEEYAKLSDEDKQRYVNEFEQKRKQHNWGSFRVSSRSRLQDTRNCIKVLQEIMTALRVRNGCKGFFVVVRGSTAFHMDPQWHFTSKEFADYLPFAMNAGRFETASVGGRLEAFAIAGCSVINTLKTSKKKADFLKKRIRDRVAELLVEITGDERAAMQYTKYETLIVHKYGVELEGPWPGANENKPSNPSDWSTSLPPLQHLMDALDAGEVKFSKLSAEEVRKRVKAYEAKAAGMPQPSKKSGKKKTTSKKSRETINDSDYEDDSEGGAERPNNAPSGPREGEGGVAPITNAAVNGAPTTPDGATQTDTPASQSVNPASNAPASIPTTSQPTGGASPNTSTGSSATSPSGGPNASTSSASGAPTRQAAGVEKENMAPPAKTAAKKRKRAVKDVAKGKAAKKSKS